MNRSIARCVVKIYAVALLLTFIGPAHAIVSMIEAAQVGGFFADGSAHNDVIFQNYHIGYGTTAGEERTTERRSFFVFDLSAITGTITSAEFSVYLPAFGLVFGKDCLGAEPCTGLLPMVDDPVTPWDDTDPGAWPEDMFEEFVIGATPIPSAIVTDPMLPADDPGPGLDGVEVFATFAETPLADPFTILPSDPFDFSGGPVELVVSFSAFGVEVLNEAIALGGDIVLTAFMPSFSFEDRMTPLGDDLVEKDELIFSLSDLVTGGIETSLPTPFLELTTTPVPIPAVLWIFAASVAYVCRGRRSGA